MDVPFHSSGAMSRAHYTIVRKVESASTIQSGDQYIFLEIKSIQEQLAHPKLQLVCPASPFPLDCNFGFLLQSHCKECLVLLLYCSISASPGFFTPNAFAFAFPHAINLAEAGVKIDDKRIGHSRTLQAPHGGVNASTSRISFLL